MPAKYDIIVIGTGCGGAAAAALSAYHGFRTLVLEKNDFVGGRCATHEIRGFKMDHGHLFAMCDKGPHGELLRIVESADLIPPFLYTQFMKSRNLAYGKLLEMPERYFQTFFIFKLFLVAMKFGISCSDIMAFLRFGWRMNTLSDKAVRKLDLVSLESHAADLKGSKFLYDLLGAMGAVSFGALPEDVSMGELYRTLGFGPKMSEETVGYPVNGEGVSAVPKSFLRAAERYGAVIRMKSPVKRIVIENGKVKAVEIEGETILADRIICNAGVRETALKLVGAEHFDPSFVSYLNNLKYSFGGISLKYALDKPILDWPQANKIPSNLMKHMRDAMEGRVPEETPMMTVCTSNLDPTLAPEGKQILVVIAPGPPVEPGKVDWTPWVQSLKKQVSELAPGIDDHTLFCAVTTPDIIAHENGRFYGDAIGVAQSIDQIHDKAPPMEFPIGGLYVVGADVGHEGVATEMATQSAIDLFEKYLKPA
jgi:phytoene dehydrogenase-like protein